MEGSDFKLGFFHIPDLPLSMPQFSHMESGDLKLLAHGAARRMGTLFACLLSDPIATLLDSTHCLGRGWGSEWGRQPLHLHSLDCLAVYFSQ